MFRAEHLKYQYVCTETYEVGARKSLNSHSVLPSTNRPFHINSPFGFM
jgi:hypothetical protein